MKRNIAIILALLVVTVSLFAGCSTKDENAAPLTGVTINVYNWGEYISNGEDDSLDLNEEFTRQTGIEVNYTTYSTNEELYAKLASGGGDYDIIIPSDYMIGKLINEGMLEEINFDNIPNYQYIDDEYKNLDYDPDNKYSVPYTWGTVGIFYNTTMVDKADIEEQSWDILWNEKYKGEILMFDNPRDAFAISLKRLGYSMNTTNEKELKEAADELIKQKDILQAYVMDQIFDKMASGEAAIAPYYAGDGIILMEQNEDIAFYSPKEGVNMFVDAMCIPKGAKNKKEAEAYINFMCSTEAALANAEYIGYSTPHTEALQQLDSSIKDDPMFYPKSDVLDNSEVFITLPNDTNTLMSELWIDIKS